MKVAHLQGLFSENITRGGSKTEQREFGGLLISAQQCST